MEGKRAEGSGWDDEEIGKGEGCEARINYNLQFSHSSVVYSLRLLGSVRFRILGCGTM